MTTCRQISSRLPKRSALWRFARGFIFLITLLSAVQVASAQPHKIQVTDPALAAQIETQGGRLIADYGSYRLYEVDHIAPEMLANGRAEMRDYYNTIFLHAVPLDTRKPEIKALRKSVGPFAGKHLHLVQFAGPVQTHWRDDLLAAGAKIISYIPENTYMVYGDADCLAQVQGLAAAAPHVQWEGAYLDNYKIHPRARTVDDQGNPRAIGTDLFDIQLVADDAANAATLQLLDRLKLEPFERKDRVLHYLDLVVRLNPTDLALVAAQPEVVSILPFFPRQKFCERQDQIVAGNLTGNVPTGPGYLAWLASVGFTQAQFTNFIVDVSDSGIDNGSTAPNHFGLHTGGDFNSASRVLYNRLEGTPNPGSTLQGCDGHGNLNATIIAGYDDFAGFPFADTNGFHYGLGVCPFVGVGSSVIFDPDYYTYPNLTNVQSDAYQNGARVSNNSFGASKSAGIYDAEAQAYDVLVRDAQPAGSSHATTGNQGMVIVFAAGNDGSAAQTIDSPGSAKNVITVGAAENVQAFGGPDGSTIGDNLADSANDVVYFSSEGPCMDGRAKPDLVAPGTHVSGGVFQAEYDLTNYPDGIAGECFNGTGVSGGPDGAYWPLNQQFYAASSGTSHSTPCVAGGCALVLQYFFNNFSILPSPAMTKAVLLNSARYLTGDYADDTLPSVSQGMGEMNLGMAFDGVPRILRDQLPVDIFTNSGQVRTFYGAVANTNNPLRVTLAWTDAPGSTSGNAYNNNLDLTVSVGGNTYKGNVFNGAFSTTGGSADVKNNVESVFLQPGVSGNCTVTVTAASINSVGVPNSSNALKQDFALVVYNASIIGIPNVAAAYTTVAAENCTPTNDAIDPGETVTVNFALQNLGTGNTTNLVATLLPNSSILSPSGPQTYGVLTAGGPPVSRPFTFEAGGVCGGTLNATFQIQDGAGVPSNLSFTLPLGKLVPYTAFTQNFDGVTAPALPAGWTTTNSGSEAKWVTSTTSKDTSPNAAFVNDAAGVGLSELVTPAIPIISPTAQLTFRNNYNLQNGGTFADDGGVLEIQIGNGAFTDIVTAGGSFVTNGYNRTISSTRSNPLAGRPAWSGSSGGFITTIANLPAAAAGQTIHLKWRCGTDTSGSGVGWFIDTISLGDSMYVCCADTADLLVTASASPSPVALGTNLNFNLTVTNLGPVTASNVIVSDFAPIGTYILTASAGFYTNLATVYWNIGDLPSGAQTNLTLTVVPIASGLITDTASATSTTYDFNLANNSATTSVTAYAPVVITTEPTNDTLVPVGANVAFQVAATGGAPIACQWYFAGAKLSGQTNFTLNLSNVQTNQTGDFTAVITNPVTVVTSTVASLTVIAPAAITAEPASQTFVATGTNVTLQVGTTGTPPIAYQWYFGSAMLTGQTNATLNLYNVQPNQSGNYTVMVTNLFAATNSTVATVTVLDPVVITAEPTNQTIVPVGTNVTFQVTATGAAPIGFQWYFAGAKLSGQTDGTLNLSNLQTNQTGNYTVVVTNPVTVVTSTVASLTVVAPVTITNNPPGQTTVPVGANVYFHVGVAGTDPIGYQWYFAGTNLVDQTNSALNLTNVQLTQTGDYVLIATNLFAAATSTVASLTVIAPPIITNEPASQTIVPVGAGVSFQVGAGGSAPFGYQWYFAATNLPGQTNSTLYFSNVQTNQTGGYTVIVTNLAAAVTSTVASLTVVTPPALTSPPSNQTAFVGTNITFQADATGLFLTYQWSLNGTNLPGATTNTLTLTNVQPYQAGSYTLIVTNIAGQDAAAAQLSTVLPPLTITVTGDTISISLASQPGLNYTLLYKDNLSDPDWTPLPNSIPGTGDTITLQDPAPSPTNRFYCVSCN